MPESYKTRFSLLIINDELSLKLEDEVVVDGKLADACERVGLGGLIGVTKL